MIKYFFSLLIFIFSSSVVRAENSITYPQRAWELEQAGNVLVVYDIGSNGRAENIRILDSKPKFIFGDDVKSQIYKWKFPKDAPRNNVKLRIIFER